MYKPELCTLQIEGLDPCRARALYQAGLQTPNDLLSASDETIKIALSKAMPSELKRHNGAHVKKGTLEAIQIGHGAHIGSSHTLQYCEVFCDVLTELAVR
jgi:hypothetical protein